jgi:seryl-tRNA synthetase/acyl carrier protein
MTTAKPLPTPEELEQQLATFINVTLLGGAANVGRDARLFEDGYMNSLRILDLIAAVEKMLGARIPDRAVRLANFRTIGTIVNAFHPDAATRAAPTAEPNERHVFERRGDRARFVSPVAALRERGDVVVTAAGQVSLSGLALAVLRAIDRTALEWARSLGATEHRYPSLIDLGVLERAGQVASFPQHLTLVGHPELSGRAETLRHPERSEGPTPLSSNQTTVETTAHAEIVGSRHALSPAVCYHAYPEWQGTTVGQDGAILTARGRCYRFEDGNLVPLERLWDFTMREIIVLGSRGQVESVRQALVRQVSDLVTTLDLDGRMEIATDPFFTAGDEGRRLMQQAGALKYELLLSVDADGRGVAAASFNHHHDFFGTRFDITLGAGTPAHSGCIAFGLERWVLAVLAQHGLDERAWPAPARSWLDDSRVQRTAASATPDRGASA